MSREQDRLTRQLVRECVLLAIARAQIGDIHEVDKRNLAELLGVTKQIIEVADNILTTGGTKPFESSSNLLRYVGATGRFREELSCLVEVVKEIKTIQTTIQRLIAGKKVFKTRIGRLEHFVGIVYFDKDPLPRVLLFMRKLR